MSNGHLGSYGGGRSSGGGSSAKLRRPLPDPVRRRPSPALTKGPASSLQQQQQQQSSKKPSSAASAPAPAAPAVESSDDSSSSSDDDDDDDDGSGSGSGSGSDSSGSASDSSVTGDEQEQRDVKGSKNPKGAAASSSSSSKNQRTRLTAASSASSAATAAARPVDESQKTNSAIFVRNLPARPSGESNPTTHLAPFSKAADSLADLSLQDSLTHEYKKLLSSPNAVAAVRVARSGRAGRFAVIYLNSNADVAKAISVTASAAAASDASSAGGFLAGSAVEAHVYLSEELIEE